MHFRGKKEEEIRFLVFCWSNTVDQYKYLGITLNENLDYKILAQELADSGGRAPSSLISKFKPYKGIGYSTFTKLYGQEAIPITDYCSSIGGGG